MSQATHVTFDARGSAEREAEFASERTASASMADTSVRLSIHESLAAVEQDWREFQQHADCTAFQSFEWLGAWQRHIGARSGAMPVVIVGRDLDGALLFIFPLAVETRGIVRRLTWLGSELCDYNAPLLSANFSQQVSSTRFTQVWREITERLQAHPHRRYDVVALDKMPEKVGDQANPFLLLDVDIHPSGAYLTHLSDDWEAFYVAKRSSATRRRDRTKRKKLSELGTVSFVNPEAADVGRTFDTLVEQKTQSFAQMGVPNLFARPGYEDFFRTIANEPAMRHMVHVSRLDVGATPAAVNLALMFRGRYYHVLASHDGGEVSRFGPGAAHLHDLMRHAIACKCDVFDFTIGDERYKRDWCDTELKLFDHVAAATLKGQPVVIASLAFSRLKRWIKQTPAVWNAFVRARAFFGSRGSP